MTLLSKLVARLMALPAPEGIARELIRHAGVDLLGCMLVGARHPLAAQTRAALASYDGKAPIFGSGRCTVAPCAVLCNAMAAHIYEFDDWEEPGNTHPSAVLFPALWAVAAERGKAEQVVSGAEIAAAYHAGFEVIAILGTAFNFEHYNQGWHSTGTLGGIGAAAAVARLLRLDAVQTEHALSLAMTQASGYVSQFGSPAKALHAGFAARNGLMAAFLAEQGLSGKAAALEGAKGFCGLMSHGDSRRLDRALEKTDGSALSEWGLVVKPYPSCGYTHRLVDCALELFPQLEMAKGQANRIQKIQVEMPDFHYAILPFDRPVSAAEARFSVPFCVATALHRGRLALDDFSDEPIGDPELQDLMAKVEVSPQAAACPGMNYDPDQPDRLRVTLATGRVLETSRAYPRGAPQNPLSMAEVRAKFDDLAGPYGGRVVDDLLRWDQSSDINRILAPFAETPTGEMS